MTQGMHTEDAFERLIVEHLVRHGGYEPHGGAAFDPDAALAVHAGYDARRALIPTEVIAFVSTTQPKPWGKLREIHGATLDERFIDALCKVLDQRGLLAVIRQGFKFHGQQIRLAYFRPGNTLNPAVWDLYAQNRLRVVRQLRFDPDTEQALDLALFINGLPIATAELKNAMTGQTVADARRQYRRDRDPKAPLFRFKARALVHFAVDTDEVWMSTRLSGLSTRFLPFNRGHDGGAGNPPVEGKHRSAYLWEEIWQRDNLLELVGRFLHLQTEQIKDPDSDKVRVKETLIFPRYHQWDGVRRLLAAAREHGAGSNYLVQHSAGSGKSNTIAWLAHRLASLHNGEDDKVYDAVIVLTDRRVLDQQLQDTIYQFEHKSGVVEKIDTDSTQLAKALEAGVPIIISTIHKFGFIQDKLQALPDRRYAIVVDEAHSSQTGEMAVTVKELLSDSSLAARLEADGEELSTPDQLALRAALFRGPQRNMSFFAFTATPKHKTMELFGHKGPDGKPAPFHLYSMRQAIEEGFILDVLRGYTTYKRFFQIAKSVADDPELDKKKAAAALARFVNLHPTNLAQKTEIIVEHFRACVMHQLKGRAKAMLVTSSRLMAVRYKQAFDAYLKEKGYTDHLRCLVAFSGEVQDPDAPGVSYSEPQMNGGIKEAELPGRFASSRYQLLIVANKYQTGFDQPLLCAMYVDKRLDGIQAVQTLSRLNRTCPGKEETFVLDFVNERESILASFQNYYETTTTADEVDPQRLYELQHELDEFQVYTSAEVDELAAVFFKLKAEQQLSDNARLNAWIDPAVDRFKALCVNPADEDGQQRQEDFRGKLNAFKNLYAFLGQIVPFADPDLEKRYLFVRLLLRKLPRPDQGDPVDLEGDVALASYKLKLEEEGDLVLRADGVGELTGPEYTGTGAAKTPKERLSTIIQVINERFGTDFDAQDLVDGVTAQLLADARLRQAARVNDKGNFAVPFREALDDALVSRHEKHGDFINQLFQDEDLAEFFRGWMLEQVYKRFHEPTTSLG
ncbi:type I restriction endonuclease subunit R [Marichromatium purpuratum 984]|uniref:Type I restriction endonuclease subunit R n=1 Tax=Marichromatium purpuratum 984 TaxID=765910 RepID=W0E4E0_MARPU|nr:type I restriction endonuclease [Marichromatium purpuratum]AHF03946.1 type I restriction endonuclease subunit R [Marichromatium purpuratum 984]